IYLLLSASLIAILQVMVYAGAVMVLFVFVIMLLNLKDEELGEAKFGFWKAIGLAAVLATAGFIGWRAIGEAYPRGQLYDNAIRLSSAGFGGVKAVGRTLYLASVLPFEVTSLLLLVAVVAAVVVATAAAEAAVGLAIIIAVFRSRTSVNVDEFDALKL